MSIDKNLLFQKIVHDLEKRLEVLVNSAIEAKEASTNEESKAENKYDTRGLEASYLASGQALRVKELQETIFKLKKVDCRKFSKDSTVNVSALVELSINDTENKWFFIIPASGISVSHENLTIQTISLEAPLGQLLYQRSLNDDFELKGKEYQILQIQ